jgi:excisionase family DNA binding protein
MMTLPVQFQHRLTLSISETAELLGIKPKTIYNQISAGSCPIRTVKIGGRRLVRVQDLQTLHNDCYPLQTPVSNRILRKTSRV